MTLKDPALQDVLDWVKETDIVELRWKDGAREIELGLESPPAALPSFPASSLVPVTSPGVGLFRFDAPGGGRSFEEGAAVKDGQTLGLIEGVGKALTIKAPAAGRLIKILAEDGAPAEFGQPLFFIAP